MTVQVDVREGTLPSLLVVLVHFEFNLGMDVDRERWQRGA
jgi:hypothetical protein